MPVDTDLQVWLESLRDVRPSVVVPYVQSPVERQVDYRVRLVRKSPAGHSEISQGGTVLLSAAQPTPLGRLSVGGGVSDVCEIELILLEAGKPAARYGFDCPR